jgi:hypothetical protein
MLLNNLLLRLRRKLSPVRHLRRFLSRFKKRTYTMEEVQELQKELNQIRSRSLRRPCILCKTWHPKEMKDDTIVPLCNKHLQFPRLNPKNIKLIQLEIKLLRRELDRKGGMVWTSDTKGHIKHATDERGFPKYPCQCPRCNLTGDRHRAHHGKTPEEG